MGAFLFGVFKHKITCVLDVVIVGFLLLYTIKNNTSTHLSTVVQVL